MKFSYLLIAFLFLVINGCSDFSSEANEFELSGKMYACDESVHGDIANDTKTGKKQYCNGLRWIDIKDSSLQDTFAFPKAGFYNPFVLKIPHDNIHFPHCTFDGSEPSLKSETLNDYIIVDSSLVIRCLLYEGGTYKNKKTESYFINEDINMPIMSISVAPEFIRTFLESPPCQPNPCKEAPFWEDVEYPAHIEFFDPSSKPIQKKFEIDAGISITGNWSRNQIKKSISVTMRKQYQKGRLIYPLFETRSQKNEFKSFILRNNGNRFVSDYIEDAVATSLLEGTNVDYARSRQVVVFYNGHFGGIYDLREKLNEHFIKTNYNIDSKKINFIEHIGTSITTINGNSKSYIDVLNAIDNAKCINDSLFDFIKESIDLDSYIDYIAAQVYFHNGDWPHNNVKIWSTNNSRWKFIAYDIDHGFDWTWNVKGFSQATNMYKWIIQGGRTGGVCSDTLSKKCFHSIFKKLIENKTFKKAFLSRSKDIYSKYINSKKIAATTDSITNSLDANIIKRDLIKYPRTRYKNSCGKGFDQSGNCIKNWAKQRDSIIKKELDAFELF